MKRVILLSVWLAAVASIAPARAQSGDVLRRWDGVSVDDHIARELQDRKGIVIVDAVLMGPKIGGGLTRCAFPEITLGQAHKDAPRKAVNGMAAPQSGKMVAFGGVTSLPPGEYLVLKIACANLNSNYNGPHAKFQVRAGEIVNVGTLHLDAYSDGLFSNTGKWHRSVEDLNPQVVAFLKTRAPRAMTKVVNRRMTMLGPAEAASRSTTRPCGLVEC